MTQPPTRIIEPGERPLERTYTVLLLAKDGTTRFRTVEAISRVEAVERAVHEEVDALLAAGGVYEDRVAASRDAPKPVSVEEA